MSPTPPEIDAQLPAAPSPAIPGVSDGPTPPQSTISGAAAGRKRLGANNVVRPAATAVKPSGKAGGKRVEAPEVAPRPPLAPVAGQRQSKPTPAKMALAEAAANKKRKKAAAALPKAAPTPPSRKASPASPPRGRPACPTVVSVDDREVFDETATSAVEEEVADFMTQLEGSHAAGIDEEEVEATEQGEVEEEEVEATEQVEVEETQGSTKKTRATNYSEKEDVALCYAWMNVSLDASVGTDQSKEKFWARIEDYYNNTVTVAITRTQGSLGHRWGAILEQCNRWSGCVDQVHTNPPSGVPVTEYGPLIQDLYKLRNKKNGSKAFNLHHCYNELVGNEKWVRRNWETTPKRSRVSISVEANDEEDEDPHKRPEGQKLAKERKKRGAQGGYKEELCAMVEAKKSLAAERRDEKAARWAELKAMEEEKWKKKMATEERKAIAEERRIALEEERIAKEKEIDERAIMFMDPSNMDAMARKYWELTRAKILQRSFGGDEFFGDGL